MKKIGEIKDEVAAAGEADWQNMCDLYREDSRSGVQKLILQYEKKIKALEAEKNRRKKRKKSAARRSLTAGIRTKTAGGIWRRTETGIPTSGRTQTGPGAI